MIDKKDADFQCSIIFIYIYDFSDSGTGTASNAYTKNVKRAEETQG